MSYVLMVITLVVVLRHDVSDLIDHGVADTVKYVDVTGLPACYGLTLFAYEGDPVALNIASSLQNPLKFPKVAIITLGLCIVMVVSVAGLSYLSLGNSVAETLLFNLDESLWYNDIVLFLYIIVIFFSIPMIAIPIVNVFSNNQTINTCIGRLISHNS